MELLQTIYNTATAAAAAAATAYIVLLVIVRAGVSLYHSLLMAYSNTDDWCPCVIVINCYSRRRSNRIVNGRFREKEATKVAKSVIL